MADRITISQGRYLSKENMDALNNLFQEIKGLFESNGYDIEALTLDSVKVDYNIDVSLILSVINNVENNIQLIESFTDFVNPYYDEFEWKKSTLNKNKQVNRWFKYLYYTYDVLKKIIKGSQYLIDEDGNYIVDKFGNYILVYKE